MNREQAQLNIDKSIGVYKPEAYDCAKSRPGIAVNSYSGLKATIDTKPRLRFDPPHDLATNEYPLLPFERKPPVTVIARPPKYPLLPQEKKVIVKSEYVAQLGGEVDTKPILQIRSPEKYIEAVCETFNGTNVFGKLAETLTKRLNRIKTQEEAQKIAEQRAEARQQRRKEQYERARETRRITVFSSAANLFAYFSALVAVLAILLGWAMRPLIVTETSGIFYYGLVFLAFVLFSVSCILNIVGKGKFHNLFNEYTLMICGVCSLAAAIYYPIYHLNKYAVIAVFAMVAIAVVAVIAYKIKKLKSKITLRAVLINLALIAFTVVVCVQLSVKTFDTGAYDGNYGDYYYNELDDGSLEVTIKKFAQEMSVPQFIDGKEVTVIKTHDASGFPKRLESLTLPDSVTAIDGDLFKNCSNIYEVSAPAFVVNSLPLTKVRILKITSGEELTDGMLRLAPALNRVEVRGVKKINSNVFSKCYNLAEVYIGDGVTEIGNAVFSMCSNLTSVRLPDTVTGLGWSLFNGCTSLQNIYLPQNITEIPIGMFNGCSELSILTIPSGVTKINSMAFAGCTSLDTLVIPEGVTDLRGDRIFENCDNIHNLTAPAEVLAQIPHDNLVSVHITGNVIPMRAFFGCRTLSIVSIAHSVTEIKERAFQGCSSLEVVNMANSVTEIGRYAFAGCRKLEEFIFPVGTTKIGGWVFEWCTALKRVSIPSTVTEIEDSAFWGCEALEEIDIPYAVENIGQGAFAHCKSLTEVSLPANVTEIKPYTFAYCTNLRNIIMPQSVAFIDSYAFVDCGLRSVYCIGTQSEWNSVRVYDEGNEPLLNAEKSFYDTRVVA